MASSPAPPVALSGHCSVISDNILYTYSPDAFQSLPLKSNGTWSQLENGVSVTGATCVLQPSAANGTSAALWVIGGVAASATTTDYPGVQRYTFADQKWESITHVVEVAKNRQSHAAVWLPDSSSILVYAGSQNGSTTPTTDTFVLSSSPPYTIRSYSTHNVPAVSPLLLQWNSTSAITMGGADGDKNIFIFHDGDGWHRMSPSLSGPPKSFDMLQATLVVGSDTSRVLELYDMSVSPNEITQVVLQNANGDPAKPGRTIARLRRRDVTEKRDLTLTDWPSYNATFAPTVTRSGFSLARSDSGLVAISGGGDTAQSVALFNDQTNKWINTTKFFGDSAFDRPIASSSSTSSTLPTSTSSTSPTPLAPTDGEHPRYTLILGITLGCVLGLVALLVIILLLIRCRRRRRAAQGGYGDHEEEDDDEKDRMSFEDRGDPFMKEIGPTYPMSHHTLSVYEGDAGTNFRSHRRSETRGSERSTTHLVPKRNDAYEMNAIPNKNFMVPSPVDERPGSNTSLQVPNNGTPKRSSGWSRYFSGTEVAATKGGKNEMGSMRSSHSSNHDCKTHGPTQLPPLDMGQQFHEGRINKAVTGNEGQYAPKYTRESEERPRTVSSTFSNPGSTGPSIWSHDGNDEQSTWTPVTRSDQWANPRHRDTAASSFYGSVDGADGDRNSRISGAVQGTGPVRMVSGAHVLPKSVMEEDEQTGYGTAPTIKVVNASTKVPDHAAVQNDLSWVNLGKK